MCSASPWGAEHFIIRKPSAGKKIQSYDKHTESLDNNYCIIMRDDCGSKLNFLKASGTTAGPSSQ